MTRRQLLSALAAIGFARTAAAAEGARPDAIRISDGEWRKRLTPDQYDVLRREGTEPPFSSPLNGEKRRGLYRCAGCELALFASEAKYDSGTGWPSFTAALAGRHRHAHRLQAASFRAPNTTARAAAGIKDTSSTTGRGRPASATATTASR